MEGQQLVLAFDRQLHRATIGEGFVATAYTAGVESTGKRPGDPAYGITRTGTVATEGRTVAVDPNVIPLGSILYIKGIGLRIAEDTGGAIKGARIDIYMDNLADALEFGLQTVRVYVLEKVV